MNLNVLDLPSHLQALIADKLMIFVVDFIRFGAVCRPWQSIYIENKHRLPRQLPFLMLPIADNNNPETRSFYSLEEKKVMNFQAYAPQNLHCRGSSHGWLATTDRNNEIKLVNPFTSINSVIHLPPFEVDEYGFTAHIYKVVLSANPTSNPNYVVMAIYGKKLVFYKPGNTFWSNLNIEQAHGVVEDVIFCGDMFYFLDDNGQVFACSSNLTEGAPTAVGPPRVLKLKRNDYPRRYLVKLGSELLQVVRLMEGSKPRHKSIFGVYKLDPIGFKWIWIDDLNGHVLFLGCNSSFSFSYLDYPECIPNSIYYTEEFSGQFLEGIDLLQPPNMGIFNLRDCVTVPHYPLGRKMILPVAIWVEPSL